MAKKSSKKSPSKSPKKSSPRTPHQTSPYEVMKWDQTLMVYVAIVVLVLVVSYLYTRKGENWWTNVSTGVPSWGEWEALILILFAVYYLLIAYAALALSRHIPDRYMNERSVAHLIFGLISILYFAYFYATNADNQNHEEGFYLIMAFVVLGLVLLYLAYKHWHVHSMWVVGVGMAIGIYLIAWAWYVHDHAT